MKFFLFLFLLSACKPSLDFFRTRNSANPEGIQSHDKISILLPESLQQVPLFQEWRRYLLQPRLAFFPQVKIQCLENPRSLTLKFSFDANSVFSCEDLIKINTLDTHWKCLSPTQLQYSLEIAKSRARCENHVQFWQLLRDVEIPSKSFALYASSNPKEFLPFPVDITQPLTETLPKIEFESDSSKLGARSLKVPTYEDWLENSSDDAAIALVISLSNKNPEDGNLDNTFYNLQRFIAQQKEPSKFRLFLNPANPIAAKQKKKEVSPFFLIEEVPNLPPPFSEVCGYVNRWLKAEQILAGLDPHTNPIQHLNCRFEWGEKSLFTPYALTLTKLPFPLVYESGQGTLIFPFRNLQDTLSANVFRSLKKP